MDPNSILAALSAHRWLLVGALVVPTLVSVAKQRSLWIAAHVPAWALPYGAVAIGVATVGSTDVVAGKTWQQALFDGLGAGVLAVFAHQTVVEGARGGKEIVPLKEPPESDIPAAADSSKLPKI